MSENDACGVDRLLAGVSETTKRAPYYWLATASEDGRANVRPMGRLLEEIGEGADEWLISFFTDGRSHKAADMRRDSRVTVILQHDASDAFVAFSGSATLVESKHDVAKRWRNEYNAFLPNPADRAHVVFVDVHVERMELWIRGVTPEPFGFHTTTLERDSKHGWRIA